MIFYYLDSSAWIKRYYQETGTTWVEDLFAGNQAIACASLGIIEVIATLARKQKAREIELALFERKAREAEDDWERLIQVHLTAEALQIAKEIAKGLALRGADAVHLASALLLQRRFVSKEDRLILVSSDQELEEAARSAGLAVIDPDQPEREASTLANEEGERE